VYRILKGGDHRAATKEEAIWIRQRRNPNMEIARISKEIHAQRENEAGMVLSDGDEGSEVSEVMSP